MNAEKVFYLAYTYDNSLTKQETKKCLTLNEV